MNAYNAVQIAATLQQQMEQKKQPVKTETKVGNKKEKLPKSSFKNLKVKQ